MSREEHRLSRAVGPEGFGGQIEVHGPGQRVGHHQGGRGEVVETDVRVDATLEIPVAREHGGHRQVAPGHGVGHPGEQGAGVADAGGAAEADEVEAEGRQGLDQAGALVVVHDHPRAGGERGLHPGLGPQAPLDGLAGQQAGGQHHLGVRGVGAAGDGGDDHTAVGDVDGGPVLQGGGGPARPDVGAGLAAGLVHGAQEAGLGAGQGHSVLGPGRAGQARLHRGRSSSTLSENTGGSSPGWRNRPCSFV